MSHEDLKRLKLHRAQLKGTVTRSLNFVNDELKFTSSSVESLQSRKDKLISTYRDYENLQLDILYLDAEDAEDVEVIEENYHFILSKINATLKLSNTSAELRDTKCVTVTTPSRLPEIDIPIFSGKDFTCYIPFIDLFTAVVHNNTSLSDVQKLFYLRKYLRDEALAIIVNLPLVNESYNEALALLKKRFDNKARLISNHINIILDLPSMQRGTAGSIRAFISEVQQQVYALKNLEQPIDKWDMLLICILTKKLDLYTNRAFQFERDPNKLPTMVDFISFLEKRALALEDSGDKSTCNTSYKQIQRVSNFAKVTPNKTCIYCKLDGHALYTCPKFKIASEVERIKFVDEHKLCTICINDHKGRCRFGFKCKVCKKGHNTLLHSSASSEQSVALHSMSSSTHMLLPTVKVKVHDCKGNQLFVRALLDSGSQASFVTSSFVKKLSLKPIPQRSNIIGIGNKNCTIDHYVNILIHSPVKDVQFYVKCYVVESITSKLPQQHLDILSYRIPDHIILSDDTFNKPDDILLLLGVDIYFKIILDGHVKLSNGPVLQNTLFGYVVGGELSSNKYQHNNLLSNMAICDTNKLENVMEQFWLSERASEQADVNIIETQKAEDIFKSSVQIVNNRFHVDIPLSQPLNELHLGDSFSIALQRFLALENKFKKDKLYLDLYKKFINEYIALGHAKVVDICDYDIYKGPVYFLAHHAVFNDNSKTTKIRVVFNGSMKSKKKISLNEVMLNGPIVQNDLFDILILFRTYIYTLICDITKMFRAIYINEHHKSLQNILWRDDPSKPILCLQLQTVTYGLKSSSYLATRCLTHLAETYKQDYPLASEVMFCNTYVDDVLSGSDDFDTLSQLKKELVELLGKGSFALHKWCSNVPDILADIPLEQQYFEDNKDISKNNIIKTLGLNYNVNSDQFTYTCPVSEKKDLQTKRNILSYIGKIFDPLGLIGPVIVIAKLFMQSLWALKIDWDTILPQAQLDVWNKFLFNLNNMGTMIIPRCISCKDIVTVELIGYADASIKAYGCCIYFRIIDQNGKVNSSLLCSKSRVAPLNKSITIPKLELNSALLLAQVSSRVFEKLKSRFLLKVYLYSDSQIVLAWVKSLKPIKHPYVRKRINEINSLTKNFQWSYVCSENNPADLLSRGTDPHKLKSNRLWWHGPTELLNSDFSHTLVEINLPLPPIEELVISNPCTTNDDKFKLFEQFSNLSKLQRIVAYLIRFKNNCLNNGNRIQSSLTPKELNEALYIIIRNAQKKYFSIEIANIIKGKAIKTNLANLHPFLDSSGILRVGGRIQNAPNLPYDKVHPAIIPKSCHLTLLLIQREHLRLLHAGPKLVLSSLSQKFYLISGMREVKKVIHKCVKCFRIKATAAKQLMGSLPKERLTAIRPFQTVGVDFCGPFNIKVARIRRPIILKAYVALYVCFATKAIHVELVSDLTTEAFLASLKRFIARRGLPTFIYCDNAKTFKGASNTLKALYDLFISNSHKQQVNNFCLEKSITFKFIPSYSPEFGGLWEAGVKSLKFHLKRIVGNISLTFEGLYTILTEIEAVLNSRPLLPLSSDVSDTSYLTPGHFLIGTSLTSFPELDMSDKNVNNLKFWSVLTKLKQDFWKVWSTDYLNQLQNRPKWQNVQPNIKEGDLVIVRSDNTSPFEWPMARVIKTFPGPDGRVRVAQYKLGNKTYVRSYKKLSPLPM